MTPACTCISLVLASMSRCGSCDPATGPLPSIGNRCTGQPGQPALRNHRNPVALHRRMTALGLLRGPWAAPAPARLGRAAPVGGLRSGVSVPRSATSAPRVEISSLEKLFVRHQQPFALPHILWLWLAAQSGPGAPPYSQACCRTSRPVRQPASRARARSWRDGPRQSGLARPADPEPARHAG